MHLFPGLFNISRDGPGFVGSRVGTRERSRARLNMSEVKSLMKAARKALDKGDYDEAVRRCEVRRSRGYASLPLLQAVLWSGGEHLYLAHVMLGKALVQLERRQEARDHYCQAIDSNSSDLLAWKVCSLSPGLCNMGLGLCSMGLGLCLDYNITVQFFTCFSSCYDNEFC